MSDYTPEAQIDWSEVVMFGEDHAEVSYFTPEDADEFFNDIENYAVFPENWTEEDFNPPF